MSTVECFITDVEALAEAVARFPELELVRGQSKFRNWATQHGRLVGDSPMVPGFTEQDFVQGCADHTIRVRGSGQAYEIGVARRRDGNPGWCLLYDNWSGGYGLEAVVGEGAKNLVQAYNEVAVAKSAELEGWNVHCVNVDGGVELHLTRW